MLVTLRGFPLCRFVRAAARRILSSLSFILIAMALNSLDKNKIKFLLLEGIHSSAVDVIRAAGYTQIETVSGALPVRDSDRGLALLAASFPVSVRRVTDYWVSVEPVA